MPSSTDSARPGAGRIAVAAALIALAAPLAIAVPAQAASASAALTWGFKASFRSYLSGTIAHGSITASTPATDDGIATTFPLRADAEGAPLYDGDVTYYGHDGVLDVTIADPSVEIDGDAATLVALVTTAGGEPTETDLAELDLSATAPATADGLATYTSVPATLTAAGAVAFSGNEMSFYTEGTVLDPVTFSVPAEVASTPTVTVDRTTGLDGTGDTITVTGEGFLPSGTATTGTRPPLSGAFTGVYVAVGKYADTWQPSEGAPSAARANALTRWALPAESMATVGGAAAGAIELTPEGTFTATFDVTDDTLDDASGTWGVYTYAAGGAVYAPFETATPITFAPRVEVSQVDDLAHLTTVTVEGRNFLPAGTATTGTRPPLAGKFTGIYVTVGKYADMWRPTESAPSSARVNGDVSWAVLAEDMATIGGAAAGAVELEPDGSFTAELVVDKHALESTEGTWGVYTFPGGGAKYAPFETQTPLAFAADSEVTDIAASAFATEISWLANAGITTGYANGDGSFSFRPLETIKRDAMAAFLYRYAGSPAVDLPETSPFVDVTPESTAFYKEIVWLSTQGITEGWGTAKGQEFRPQARITRDAMAAFLYRFAGSPEVELPETDLFADVTPTSTAFYDEITWLGQQQISTGWDNGDGTSDYRPLGTTKRDAMAAFLYRFHYGA